MPDPLALIRSLTRSRADAIRWACVLEATAPKAGNVFPGRPFPDLGYADFVAAAEIASDWLPRAEMPLGDRIRTAVERTLDGSGKNVNLGILLLLGPLVIAEELLDPSLLRPGSTNGTVRHSSAEWQLAVQRCLESIEPSDSRNVMRAIAIAAPRGIGRVEQMDVNDPAADHDDLVGAMRTAADRDRVARQYAVGFHDLFQVVVPMLDLAIREQGDLLSGISLAHLRLLADEPDTLIARTHGVDVAQQVQIRARRIDPDDLAARDQFDGSLRSQDHRKNPGTTADLIAASLYILLRRSSTGTGTP